MINGVLRVAVDPKQQMNQRGLMRFAKVVYGDIRWMVAKSLKKKLKTEVNIP